MLLLLVALAFLWLHPIRTYAQWRSTVGQPAVAIGIGSFFAALLSHMWVGLRDVLIDYARPAPLRVALLFVVGTALLGTAAWVLRILVRTLA
jgi:succinate dehydrogenase / fumarate reductase, membrane anchor subunit